MPYTFFKLYIFSMIFLMFMVSAICYFYSKDCFDRMEFFGRVRVHIHIHACAPIYILTKNYIYFQACNIDFSPLFFHCFSSLTLSLTHSLSISLSLSLSCFLFMSVQTYVFGSFQVTPCALTSCHVLISKQGDKARQGRLIKQVCIQKETTW